MNIKLKTIGLLLTPLVIGLSLGIGAFSQTNKQSLNYDELRSSNPQNESALKSVVYLVLSLTRGGYSNSSVAIPTSSIEECQEQGAAAVAENTKEFETLFWCIDGVK